MSLLFVGYPPKIKETLYPKYIDRPLALNDPDTILVETEKLNLGAAEIRDLRTLIATKPAIHKTKIVVVTEAQKLTVAAQNALLKTLEEPPENTTIILITSAVELLLPTILSRCRVIYVSTENTEPSKDSFATLKLIDESSIPSGFAWAKKMGDDRQAALLALDSLLVAAHRQIRPQTVRKLLTAKKQLLANTNVRLTLENLFLD